MLKLISFSVAASAVLLCEMQFASAQIAPAPGGPIGAPTAESIQGFIPKDLPPPSSDPRDLSGSYQQFIDINPAQFLAGAAPAGPQSALSPSETKRMMCVPSVGSAPDFVLQTPGRIVFILGEERMVRRIYLDREFPKEIKPTYVGYSIGHWEGDTLIVRTRAMKNSGILRGALDMGPNLSERLMVEQYEERIHKLPNGDLEIRASADGLDAQGKPAHVVSPQPVIAKWRPDIKFLNISCEAGAGLFFTKDEER